MTRGSYSTPVIPSRETSVPLGISDPRAVTWQQYGHTHTTSITPSDFALPLLAAEFADAWLALCQEQGTVRREILTPLRQFVTHVGNQPHAAEASTSFTVCDLRRRHLDAWEMDLLAAHRRAGTDTNYRTAIYVFAMLDRIDADRPGRLHPEVVARLESETRLRHHRNAGRPAFTPAEVKRIRSAAHRQVHAHLRSSAMEPTRDVLTALHILLSLATGEPPEVLRALDVASVVATAAPEHDEATRGLTPAERLAWLAERDLVDQYAVTFRKNRAKETYQSVFERRDYAAHRTLTAVIRATAALRTEANANALWLQRRADGSISQPFRNTDSMGLGAWLDVHGIDVEGDKVWGRLRKVVVAREVMADPRRYLTTTHRHSPQTFFAHYTNSHVLRAHAGRLLLDSAESMFQAAIAAPTVVTDEAERLLGEGHAAPGLDQTTATALLNGDLDGPQTACRDPKASPFEDPGVTCSRSMTGSCFGCGNALITRHHLPAALAIAELADPRRAADPAVWQEHWQPIHDIITKVVLPAFPDDVVERARSRMTLVPIDSGTSNDMRGVE